MTQSLYVKCKLVVSSNFRPQIDETLEGFVGACTQILFVAEPEKCWKTAKLHHQAYKPVREATGQHAGQSRLSATKSVKLLAYLIDRPDTLVIPSCHITWGFAPTDRGKRRRVCRRTTIAFYIPQLFGQTTAPAQAHLGVLG